MHTTTSPPRALSAITWGIWVMSSTNTGSTLPATRKTLLHGTSKKVSVRFQNRYGRTRSYQANFEGAIPYLRRRHSEADSDWAREQAESYMRQVACSHCGGARLNPLALAVTIDGLNVHDLSSMSISDAADRLVAMKLDERQLLIAC